MDIQRSLNMIQKFDGKDFAVWRAQVRAVLDSFGHSEVIEDPSPDPVVLESKSWLEKDKKVRSLLLLALDNKFVKHVLQCTTAKQIWDKLSSIHAQKSSGSKMILQKQFYDLQMLKNESMSDYMSRVEYLASQLNDVGVEISDDNIVGKIVSGLSRRYQSFVSSWVATDTDKQTLENLTARLLAEEQMQSRFDPQTSSALSTNSKRSSSKNKKKKEQKGLDKNNTNSNNKRREKKKLTKEELADLKSKSVCHNCQEKGHWQKECPKKKSEVDTDNPQSCVGALIVEANTVSSQNEWVLDTGATDHMTYDDSFFVSYKVLDDPIIVSYGDGRQGKGVGVGNIKIECYFQDGRKHQLLMTDVLYVPGLKRKLMSLSCITDRGNCGEFTNDQILVKSSSNKVLLVATKKNGLYYVEASEVINEALATSTSKSLSLWHDRLGHINKTYIERMVKNHSALGLDCNPKHVKLPEGDTIGCEACAIGKQSKKPFLSRSTPRSTTIGARVHVDICGPIATASIAGSHYFVLYKDEFSNFRLIYFIVDRTEAFATLQKATVTFLNEGKHRILKIISDRGSEFTSTRSEKFLLDNKILHEVSAPHTPAQNGLIERDNRTVAEMFRSMLVHRKVPEKFWAEAANSAVYILNRTVNHKSIITPYEIFYGSKPKLNHIRTFGCVAYMKIPEKKRSGWQRKLDPRAKKVMFVGYDLNFNYRLYDADSNQIVVSREVYFNESECFVFDQSPSYIHIEALIESLSPQNNSEDQSSAEENELTNRDIAEAFGDSFASANDISSFNMSNPFGDDELDLVQCAPRSSTPTNNINQCVDINSPRSIHQQPTARQATQPPVREPYNLRSRRNASFAEALAVALDEPLSYEDAISSKYASEWRTAMKDEYQSLMKNHTWDLVPTPANCKPISCRWVFKVKEKDNKIVRFKARLVARGYTQKYGIDYQETFSPVVKVDTIRVLLVLANQFDWHMLQMDVKTAFLHGSLDETIFMQQPQGFERGSTVCKLNKAIYGLKQASRQWNRCFAQFLNKFNLQALKSDTCVFANNNLDSKRILIVCIYVDDGLVMSDDEALLLACISHLKQKFEITVHAPDTYVGIQIKRNRREGKLTMFQSSYVTKVINKFEMSGSTSVSIPMLPTAKFTKDGANGVTSKFVDVPYRQLIGSLLYAAIATRPDISYSVAVLSRFCENPTLIHWNSLKRVLRYLVDKGNYGILCSKKDHIDVLAYSDADFAGCSDTRKSTSGHLILLAGTPIIWRSTKQTIVATSTCEAEFVSASQLVKDIIWLKNLLSELIRIQVPPVPLLIDNLGTIKLIQNNQSNSKTKHLDIKLHHVRDAHERKTIKVLPVSSEKQLADIFTKPLPQDKFYNMLRMIGIVKLTVFFFVLFMIIEGNESLFLSERYEIEPHQYVLGYNSACRIPVNEFLKQEIIEFSKQSFTESKSGRHTFVKSYELYQFERCVLHAERLSKMLEILPLSLKRIAKRNLVDSIFKNGIIVAKVIKAMATIWIQGGVKRVILDAAPMFANALVNSITTTSMGAYNSSSLVPAHLNRDEIIAVSEHVSDYPSLLDRVVEVEPYLEKFVDYNHNEMFAAEVLLLAIMDGLKQGFLDTKALGELVNDSELASLDSRAMHVSSVVIDTKQKLLHFTSDLVTERSIWKRIIWIDVLVTIGLIVVFSLVLIAAYTYKLAVRRDERTRATVEQIQIATAGGTASHCDLLTNEGRSIKSFRSVVISRGDVSTSKRNDDSGSV